jgi:hypothetical protein
MVEETAVHEFSSGIGKCINCTAMNNVYDFNPVQYKASQKFIKRIKQYVIGPFGTGRNFQ